MPESTPAVIVLVAAQENLLNNLRGALAHTNLALLHAHSKQEAIALLAGKGHVLAGQPGSYCSIRGRVDPDHINLRRARPIAGKGNPPLIGRKRRMRMRPLRTIHRIGSHFHPTQRPSLALRRREIGSQ